MKHLVFFLFCAILFFTACTKPNIKPNKKDWRKSDMKIVMLGDSETRRINHYWGADTNWTTLIGYDSIFNYGYDAFQSGMILNAWGSDSPIYQAIRKNPDVIFLMIGINDAHQNIPENTTFQNIQTIIDTIQAHGIDLIIQSVLPTTNWYDTTYGGFPQNGILAQRAASLNVGIQLLCQQNNVPFLELRPDMTTLETSSDPSYLRNDMSIDGIHLNYSGYTVWKNKLLEYMNNNY